MNPDWEDGFEWGFEAATLLDSLADPKWQEVTVDPRGAGHTYRLKVAGGYLYRTVTYRYPELHKMWEEYRGEFNGEADLKIRKHECWNDKDIVMSMEIVAQTTIFVPDGD